MTGVKAMTQIRKKKVRVIREDVKERHTSHWDLDYLSREELERLMTPNRESGEARDTEAEPDSTKQPGK